MAGNPENGGRRRVSRWRIAAWAVAALILLLPLVAMEFTDEVVWEVTDFAVFGALLVGVGVTFELAASWPTQPRRTSLARPERHCRFLFLVGKTSSRPKNSSRISSI